MTKEECIDERTVIA